MNLDMVIKYLTQNAPETEVFRVMTQSQIDKNMANLVDRFPNVMKHRVLRIVCIPYWLHSHHDK